MVLTNKYLTKMSEASIAEAYSHYLQKVLIIEIELGTESSLQLAQRDFLSYDEFKDYYILALVGKDNYLENLAQKIQHQNLIEQA